LESAIKEGTTLNPAGVFYFKIDYPIIKADKDMSDEDLQKEIFKRLRLEGLVLKDEQIIKEMDKSIEGTSYIIPATINKDGSIGKNTKGATKEQFELLRKHVKKTIQRLTEEMLEGNISISPYKKDKETPCKYCPYSSICQFEKNFKDNDYRVIKTKDVEEIWSMLEQEVKTDGDYVDS